MVNHSICQPGNLSVTKTDLDVILGSDPVEVMEAAKRLVDQHNPRHVETLVLIASTKTPRLWSRIAALWTLGFIDDDGISVPDLQRIAEDDSEPAEIKDHALEALETMRMLGVTDD
jgi:hypothetical protein